MEQLSYKFCSHKDCPIKESQLLNCFPNDKGKPDGKHKWCRTCCARVGRERYKNKKDEILAKNALWIKSDKGKESQKRYRKSEAGKIVIKKTHAKRIELGKNKEYLKNKYLTDSVYAIEQRIRTRMRQALKAKSSRKENRTVELLGCSISFLQEHLESLFQPGMSWSNHGVMWHIDHIKPCSLFDLNKESEQRICFNYRNLQPLWRQDNIKKSDIYDWNSEHEELLQTIKV